MTYSINCLLQKVARAAVLAIALWVMGSGLRATAAPNSGDWPFDVTLKRLPPLIPGDLNGDIMADCSDLGIIAASFHKRYGQPGFDARADLNDDGEVNWQDWRQEIKLIPRRYRCTLYKHRHDDDDYEGIDTPLG